MILFEYQIKPMKIIYNLIPVLRLFRLLSFFYRMSSLPELYLKRWMSDNGEKSMSVCNFTIFQMDQPICMKFDKMIVMVQQGKKPVIQRYQSNGQLTRVMCNAFKINRHFLFTNQCSRCYHCCSILESGTFLTRFTYAST